jgi:hypothetical protein
VTLGPWAVVSERAGPIVNVPIRNGRNRLSQPGRKTTAKLQLLDFEWSGAAPTRSYATLDPGLLAPTIGWLSHESCQVIGEPFVAIAGRVARADEAETPGLQRSSWTMEDVAENNLIRDTSKPVIFPVMPTGHDHTAYGFTPANARSNEASASQQVNHV